MDDIELLAQHECPIEFRVIIIRDVRVIVAMNSKVKAGIYLLLIVVGVGAVIPTGLSSLVISAVGLLGLTIMGVRRVM